MNGLPCRALNPGVNHGALGSAEQDDISDKRPGIGIGNSGIPSELHLLARWGLRRQSNTPDVDRLITVSIMIGSVLPQTGGKAARGCSLTAF